MVLRRMLLMLAAVAVVVLALAAYKGYSIYQQVQMFSAPPPPISVEAEPARSLAWQQRLPAIGSLKAVQGVDLTAEISGTVSFGKETKGKRRLQISPADGKALDDGSNHWEILIPKHRQITVFEGEQVEKGETLSDGPLAPRAKRSERQPPTERSVPTR